MATTCSGNGKLKRPKGAARAGATAGGAKRGNPKHRSGSAASQTVGDLLLQISRLPETDRLLLERRLAERAEAEWMRSARTARKVARARGLNQATIDRAVEQARYAPRRNGGRG